MLSMLAFGGKANAAIITSQGTWVSTLHGRDAAGNSVAMLSGGGINTDLRYVYDSVLDLTWFADWGQIGALSWAAANAWASGITDFGGGWVLASVADTGNAGCDLANTGTDCGYNVYGGEVGRRDSPLAHMFYDTLGNLGLYDASGIFLNGSGLTNSGPFASIQSGVYWSRTSYSPSPALLAWNFNMSDGYQAIDVQVNGYYAVAVRGGDILATSAPAPNFSSLLGSALLLLLAVKGRFMKLAL